VASSATWSLAIDEAEELTVRAVTGRRPVAAWSRTEAGMADDEVYMFNALWLKGHEGRGMYAEYGTRAMQLVERLGGGIDYVLSPVDAVDDEFVPDVLAVIRYPSRQVFDDMMASDEYREFAHLRTDAAERAILTECRKVQL
jgi:uncharacterized protein (DUF1330 family)